MRATIDNVDVEIGNALISKYNRPLPRYTSYPPANRWGLLDAEEYARSLNAIRDPRPGTRGPGSHPSPYPSPLGGEGRGEGVRVSHPGLSLYIHIPFCKEKCSFCGCNSIATSDRSIIKRYIGACIAEINLVSEILGRGASVAQVHFGGGTPTSVGIDGVEDIVDAVSRCFDVVEDAELGIELDPRTISPVEITELVLIGFNRMSFGIQDFDEHVGRCIGRSIDTKTVSTQVIAACNAGVSGINFDLMYGLPLQETLGWQRTLGEVVDIEPDRIAVFNFAYLPKLLPHQCRLDASLIPSAAKRLALFATAVEHFQRAGYTFIGLDHFAREEDALARAHRSRTLTRNFQGYTAVEGLPIVGIGQTSISEIGDTYAQNEKRLIDYLRVVEKGNLATSRGIRLSRDDEMRRFAIRRIMCTQGIDRKEFTLKWGADPLAIFHGADAKLNALADDGLVLIQPDSSTVTPLGRLFIRAIAAAFDRALDDQSPMDLYSRGI